jgi:hypothetical protein
MIMVSGISGVPAALVIKLQIINQKKTEAFVHAGL